jgi:predicted aldo/keto reductase-like oxidoreductase
VELFKEIIDDYDWDFCQIQLNYLDENYQAGVEGMRYAADKGIGVIIMEPLRGGMLSRTELPPEVEALWKAAEQKRTPTEWALRYVWDFPEVGVVLSGMTMMDHVVENLHTASEALPQSLSDHDKAIIQQVKTFYHGRMVVNCTNCRYCMPCPAGVNIPELFWAYNHDAMFNDFGKAKYWVTGWLKEHERASKCVDCGACEDHCPQNISIREHLKKVAEKYE